MPLIVKADKIMNEVKEMLTEARQNMIENYVNQHGLCRVNELCELTDTSESTIRRDLIQMEESGTIKRVHGGARSVKNFSRDVSQHIRFNLNHKSKVKIARYAAEKVQAGDDIFIDAGTTTYEMVAFLADIPNLTIITNQNSLVFFFDTFSITIYENTICHDFLLLDLLFEIEEYCFRHDESIKILNQIICGRYDNG